MKSKQISTRNFISRCQEPSHFFVLAFEESEMRAKDIVLLYLRHASQAITIVNAIIDLAVS